MARLTKFHFVFDHWLAHIYSQIFFFWKKIRMIRILVLLTILSGTIAFDDQLTNCPKDVIPYSPHNLNPQNISLAATGFWTWPVEGNKGGSSNEVFCSVCTCCDEIWFLKMNLYSTIHCNVHCTMNHKKFHLFIAVNLTNQMFHGYLVKLKLFN